tara:strand:+ start:655 stop:879 length:225 start_codon:yes stop_codon:yes gene_type:complete
MTQFEIDFIAAVVPGPPGRDVPGWDFVSVNAPDSVIQETYEKQFGRKPPHWYPRDLMVDAIAALNSRYIKVDYA